MEYKVLKLSRFYKKKDGTSFKSGTSRLGLSLDGVEGQVSVFDDGDYRNLKEGDILIGSIVEKNGFKNFEPGGTGPMTLSRPPESTVTTNQKLDEILSILRPQATDKAATRAPQEDDTPDDLPF